MIRVMGVYLLLILLHGSDVYGGTVGKITGFVTDTDGNPLAGANIIIKNTTLGAAADNSGQYFILNVPPGEYILEMRMIGYKTLHIENVKVQSDLTTTINGELELTVLESGEEITVEAQRPLVQKDATASASVISSDIIQDSPVETFQALVQTKAGVTVDAAGELHVRGGRSEEIAYYIDGMPNINPYHSGMGVDIATNAIQELSVITGSFSAEYGEAMSGVINIVTKEPTDKYHGSMSVMTGDQVTDYSIDIHNIIQSKVKPYSVDNVQEFEATLTGPIPFLRKLKFFTSLRSVNDKGYLYGLTQYTPYGRELDSTEWKAFAMNPEDKVNWQFKLNYYLLDGLKLQYSMYNEYNYWQSYSHGRKYITTGHYNNYKNAFTHMLKMTHQLSPKQFYSIGYSRAYNSYDYYAFATEQDPRYVWSGYYLTDDNYEFYTGGTNNGRYDRDVITDVLKAEYTGQVNRQHEVKAGFEYDRHDINLHTWTVLADRRDEPWIDANSNDQYDDTEEFEDLNGDGVWNAAKDDNNDGIYGNTIVPDEGPNNTSYHRNPVSMSAYILDKIELKDLVMNIGLRWDYYNPDGYIAQNWYNPDPDSTLPASIKQQINPRFSIAYPITERGKLFFSYGHFFQMPPYDKLYLNPNFAVLPGLIKSDIGNADLKPQKTVSYEVGFEQQFTANSAVYLKLFYRDMRNLLGQRVYILPGGSDSYALFINRDWGNVKGFTVSFDQRLTGLVSGTIDYTYQVAVGNESDPTQTRRDFRLSIEPQKKVVPLNWDQPHTFRLVMNLGYPNQWRISTIARIESGYPYTPSDVNAIVQVAEENSGRKPMQSNTDVTAYKVLRMRQGSSAFSIRLFVKIYNLFDRKNENYVWDSSGRAGYSLGRYGDESTPEWTNRPNWYSKPRQIFFGLATEF